MARHLSGTDDTDPIIVLFPVYAGFEAVPLELHYQTLRQHSRGMPHRILIRLNRFGLLLATFSRIPYLSLANREHGDWYRALWGPNVEAAVTRAADLAGYRNGPVFIRKSMHTPPPREAVRDLMPLLFELLAEEEDAAVRVVLGHFVFVYIHPYMDGNGRIGRFLMNEYSRPAGIRGR